MPPFSLYQWFYDSTHRSECTLSTFQIYRVKQLPLAMGMPQPITPSYRYDIVAV